MQIFARRNVLFVNKILFVLIIFLCFIGWRGVATWRWIANDDNCGICRMPFDASCPDCKILQCSDQKIYLVK